MAGYHRKEVLKKLDAPNILSWSALYAFIIGKHRPIAQQIYKQYEHGQLTRGGLKQSLTDHEAKWNADVKAIKDIDI